jgi:hypothetical protein
MFLTRLTPTQTHSDGFWAEKNREEFLQEWLWKCRRKQCEVYDGRNKHPPDVIRMKQKLVTEWGQCTEAEFENKMPAAIAALANFHRARAGLGGYGRWF